MVGKKWRNPITENFAKIAVITSCQKFDITGVLIDLPSSENMLREFIAIDARVPVFSLGVG